VTLAGRTIGGCALEAPLGAGAGGRVYRGRQLFLDRPVAVKVIHDARASATALERFQREARAAARVEHASVARVFELGHEDGAWFIVQELVEGETLAARIAREGPLAVAAALRIGADVAAGLAAIHEQRIIHRDVKPENIVLGLDGAAKLVDFGLALELEQSGGRATRTGQLLGTPRYVAPEQVSAKDVGPASDAFGLGAALHAALTGKAPHEVDDDSSIMALIMRRVREPAADVASAARTARPGWPSSWPRCSRPTPPRARRRARRRGAAGGSSRGRRGP
jgi:eukaryotic-like serine/threonine-protein kinase